MNRNTPPPISIVFGLQALRGLNPGLTWYLRDAVGLDTISLIPSALGVFWLGSFAILFNRVFESKLSP